MAMSKIANTFSCLHNHEDRKEEDKREKEQALNKLGVNWDINRQSCLDSSK